MTHGTEKTVVMVGDSSFSDIRKFNGVYGEKSIRSYRVKVRVANSQAEMSEYLKFSEEIAKLRQDGRLTVDKEDSTTYPSFMIQYPRDNVDGSYTIVKCYTVILDT